MLPFVYLISDSPLILGAISESMAGGLNEDIAGGIGMIALIIFVAIAAAMFISSSNKSAPFAYLEKENLKLSMA